MLSVQASNVCIGLSNEANCPFALCRAIEQRTRGDLVAGVASRMLSHIDSGRAWRRFIIIVMAALSLRRLSLIPLWPLLAAASAQGWNQKHQRPSLIVTKRMGCLLGGSTQPILPIAAASNNMKQIVHLLQANWNCSERCVLWASAVE